MTSNEPTHIGELIRSLRQELGLTQEKFAAKVGVTFPTVNCWENNRAYPSPPALEKLETIAQQLGNGGQQLLSTYRSETKL